MGEKLVDKLKNKGLWDELMEEDRQVVTDFSSDGDKDILAKLEGKKKKKARQLILPIDGELYEETEEKPKFNLLRFHFTAAWAKWVGIGLTIVVLLVGGYILLSQVRFGSINPAEARQAIVTPPTLPNPTPIDLGHVIWLSVVQYTVTLLSFLIIVGIAADAWNRGQISDFIGIAFGIVLIMCHGLISTALIGFLGPGTWLNLSYIQLDWAISLFCVGVAVSSTFLISQQGGLDLTPLAGFFTILGASGLLFGHMGAIQILLNIPDSPVLPISQVVTLFSLKRIDQVTMSLLTFTMLGAGSTLYLIEMIRTIVKEIDRAESRFFYGATSIVGIVGYFLAKNKLLSLGTPPMLVIILAILAGSAAAFAYRKTNKKSNAPVGQGEIRLRNAWIPPWDKISVQIAPALLLIGLTGRIF